MLSLVFVLPVLAGFPSNPFVAKREVRPAAKHCPGVTKLTAQAVIDVDCPLVLDPLAYPISLRFTEKHIRRLSHASFVPRKPVAGTLSVKPVWTGPSPIGNRGFCFENEACRFRVGWSRAHGWSVQFEKEWRFSAQNILPTTTIRVKRADPPAILHTISFLGPLHVSLFVNRVAFNASWIEAGFRHSWCFFCSPAFQTKSLPALYNSLPLGMLGIQKSPLPMTLPVLNEGFVSLNF